MVFEPRATSPVASNARALVHFDATVQRQSAIGKERRIAGDIHGAQIESGLSREHIGTAGGDIEYSIHLINIEVYLSGAAVRADLLCDQASTVNVQLIAGACMSVQQIDDTIGGGQRASDIIHC